MDSEDSINETVYDESDDVSDETGESTAETSSEDEKEISTLHKTNPKKATKLFSDSDSDTQDEEFGTVHNSVSYNGNKAKKSITSTLEVDSEEESISPQKKPLKGRKAMILSDSDSQEDLALDNNKTASRHTQKGSKPIVDSESDSQEDFAPDNDRSTSHHTNKAKNSVLSTSHSDTEEDEENQVTNKLSKSRHSTKIDDYSETGLEIEDTEAAKEDNNELIVESSNLSTSPFNINNMNLSSQFDFKTKGLLNSTSVHRNITQPWRPSIPHREVDTSLEILSDDSNDIIDVSSDCESPVISPLRTKPILQNPKSVTRQQTLDPFVKTESPQKKQQSQQQKAPLESIRIVSKAEYEAQKHCVQNLEEQFIKMKSMADSVEFDALPDKGALIKTRLRVIEQNLNAEKRQLNNMEVSNKTEENKGATAKVNWKNIEAGAAAVLPKTFGKQAMSTYNAQKALTMDRLQQLHGALETCPKEDDFAEDPPGIKVPLMAHQRRALAWLLFREKAKPSGGILADDMGLGKTLTLISLIIKSLSNEKENSDSDEENQFVGKNSKYNGGSLIVCPASLINQWSGEIEKRLKRGLISFNVYHGSKRECQAKKLAKYDVVITTYSIVNVEASKNSVLFNIKWRRIVLDEAHQIRNPKALTSQACCQLSGKSRWALTGTPMHNKELDMYSLLKFLRCTPFDDIQVWRRWVSDKSSGGQERLHTVISSIMLRRTKAELIEKCSLQSLPEKKWSLVKVELDSSESAVYHKVLIFSQTLFAQFLHQRAEKNADYRNLYPSSDKEPNKEYYEMRKKLLKLNKVKNVSQHEILVLLLRLRQICCHPSLITAMLCEGEEDVGQGDDECEQLNLLEQLEKLEIEDHGDEEYQFAPNDSVNAAKVNLKEAAKGQFRASDPIFSVERVSSKIKYMLKVLKQEVLCKTDKAIIVSQWPSYLNLIAIHLKQNDVEFCQLDGTVPVPKRMEIVDKINNPKDPTRVMLLSLTAGGVGLNLVGANHLFLLDLHWNPQLENQAQDRIYRMGQEKPVFVYKFMAVNTIEERIKMLQDKKLAMADNVLTGTKQVVQNKLTLNDLKMIFGMS